MGPREALEQISAMIKVAVASDDLQAIHALLREMQGVTERAIGSGTLRRAKLVRMAKAG
jgi:predicted dinucleotide-binding enzyme